MILGVQKAGTSSLFRILDQHSKLNGSSIKETHFFNNDKLYNSRKSIDYYESLFKQDKSESELNFEATPKYIFIEQVASRLYKYRKDLKFIVNLREPASRFLSQWSMHHYSFKEGPHSHLFDPRPFKDVVNDEIKSSENKIISNNSHGYLARGYYAMQLSNLFKYFKEDQVFICDFDKLKNHDDDLFMQIQEFLNVPIEKLTQIHAGKSRVDYSNQHEKELMILKEHYQPYNKDLSDMYNINLNW